MTTDIPNGLPPVFAAVEAQDDTTLRRLLEQGADPNHALPNGNTPLHCATGDDDKARLCLKELLQHGADANRRNARGETPLYLAVRAGAYFTARELLEHGADPELRTYDGEETPLMASVYNRSISCALLLMWAGVDHTPVNAQEASALDLARQIHNTAVAWRLEGYIRTKHYTEFTPDDIILAATCAPLAELERLLQNGADPNAEDYEGCTPLDYATMEFSDYTERRRLLISYGADYCHRDKWGVSKLYEMFDSADGDPDNTAIEDLLRGFDINRLDKSGCNILHYAAFEGFADVVKRLLALGADPAVRTAKGALPLEIAMGRMLDDNYDHDKIVEILRPISPEPRQPLPRRLGYELVRAAQTGDKETMRKLLAEGAPAEGDDWGVISPCGFEAIPIHELGADLPHGQGDETLAEMAQMLLDAGADPNRSSFDYYSPLHAAASRNYTALIRVLLEGGADPTAISCTEGTPLDVALYFRHKEAANLLYSWMKEHNQRTDIYDI